MRSVSARRRLASTLALLGLTGLAAGLLTGCSTTREKAARYQLKDARISYSTEHPTKVRRAGGPVRVVRIAVTTSGKRSAFTVTLHNTSRRTRGDLPVSVGYTLGSRRVYLNKGTAVQYFGTHLPPVGSHKSLVWVYVAKAKLPKGSRPFAFVGASQSVRAQYTQTVQIKTTASSLGNSRIRVKLTNLSDIPQYAIPVYAEVRGPHGYVAAGSRTVAELDPGVTRKVRVTLIGHTTGGRVAVAAIPTILK